MRVQLGAGMRGAHGPAARDDGPHNPSCGDVDVCTHRKIAVKNYIPPAFKSVAVECLRDNVRDLTAVMLACRSMLHAVNAQRPGT